MVGNGRVSIEWEANLTESPAPKATRGCLYTLACGGFGALTLAAMFIAYGRYYTEYVNKSEHEEAGVIVFIAYSPLVAIFGFLAGYLASRPFVNRK